MTNGETTLGLQFLKKIKLPTSHIRSNRLRSRYTALRERGTLATPKSSSSSDEGRPPSRIPIPSRSTPQVIRGRNSRGQSRFPNIYNRRNR